MKKRESPETKVYEAKVAWNCRFTKDKLSRKQFIKTRSCGFLKKKINICYSQ